MKALQAEALREKCFKCVKTQRAKCSAKKRCARKRCAQKCCEQKSCA